jgi:hypothetical protein
VMSDGWGSFETMQALLILVEYKEHDDGNHYLLLGMVSLPRWQSKAQSDWTSQPAPRPSGMSFRSAVTAVRPADLEGGSTRSESH